MAATLPEEEYKYFNDPDSDETVYVEPASEQARTFFTALLKAMRAHDTLATARDTAYKRASEVDMTDRQKLGLYGHAFNAEAKAVEDLRDVFEEFVQEVAQDATCRAREDS